MIQSPTTIAPFYKGWNEYQHHLARVVAPLTSEQMALQTAPHLRPVGMTITHIITVRAGWFYFVLNERDERLVEFTEWEEWAQPYKSSTELVRGLETTWQVIEEALNRWTVAELNDEFWDQDDTGKPVGPLTRQWVLWHLIEHDLHHGGELSFTLGTHGVAGINL